MGIVLLILCIALIGALLWRDLGNLSSRLDEIQETLDDSDPFDAPAGEVTSMDDGELVMAGTVSGSALAFELAQRYQHALDRESARASDVCDRIRRDASAALDRLASERRRYRSENLHDKVKSDDDSWGQSANPYVYRGDFLNAMVPPALRFMFDDDSFPNPPGAPSADVTGETVPTVDAYNPDPDVLGPILTQALMDGAAFWSIDSDGKVTHIPTEHLRGKPIDEQVMRELGLI